MDPGTDKRGTILVVDDSSASLAVVQAALDEGGYHVSVETCGEKALQRAALVKPDLILLATVMPGLDGYEICRRLKAQDATRDIPVVLLSAYEGAFDRAEGFRQGAVDYLIKPTVAEELLARVETHITIHRLQHELQAANRTLEHRVADRTAELVQTNARLQQELVDRKLAEEALRVAEQKYRQIVETSQEGIILADEGTCISFVNPRMAELLGYTADELSGRPLSEFMVPEELADHAERMRRMRAGQADRYECRFRRRDGHALVVLSSATPLFDEAGCFCGSLAMLTDITEQKRTETSLRESEQRLRAIADGSPIPTFAIDRHHRVMAWNSALEEFSGIRAADIVGTKEQWRAFYTAERPCLADLIMDGAIDRLPTWYRDKWARSSVVRGAYEASDYFPHMKGGRWLFFTAAALRDAEGQIVGAMETLQDHTERKRTEAALRESEERFRQVAELAGEWIWEVNAEGLYTYASPVVCNVLGYRPAEIVGKLHFHDLLSPEAGEEPRQRAREAFGRVEPIRGLITPTRHKNGSTVILQTDAAPVVDENGSLLGYRGAATDITERVRAEKRTAELNHLKEQLLKAGSCSEKLQLITDGVVRAFGADFVRIWLTREADLCDKGCRHAAAKEGPHVCLDRTRCLHLVASAGRYPRIDGSHRRVPMGRYKIGRVASGEEPSFVTNDVTRDARVHDPEWACRLGLVSFAGYRLQNTAGDPIGVMALFSKHVLSVQEVALLETVTGIASQVILASVAQEALWESERKLRRAEAIGHLGYWNTNLRTGESTWSEEMYRIYGLDKEQPAPEQGEYLKLVHPDDRERLAAAANTIRREGGGAFEYRIIRGDGEVRQVIAYGETVRDESGEAVALFGTTLDVTELKNKERELREKNAELERFTYTISHDLRSPLVTIKAFLGYLEKDLSEANAEHIEKDVSHIRNAATKMGLLLDELLTLSRIGRQVTVPESVPLQVVVQEAIALVAGRITERGIEVKVTNAPCTLYGDQPRLVEVFQNLLDNAAKFMGDQPRPLIEIDVQARGGEAVILVRDNGGGIDPRHQDRLFGMFEKLQPEIEGTGMGLVIVKRIVEVHGGRIWAESEGVGHGATFFFTLARTILGR